MANFKDLIAISLPQCLLQLSREAELNQLLK